jgi:hypothetical protein
MPTECSAKPMGFARVDGRSVVADFEGGAITSNAGGLLLGATDRAIPPPQGSLGHLKRLNEPVEVLG